MKVIRDSVIAIIVLVLTSCIGDTAKVEVPKIVKRVTSPDRTVDAVLVKNIGGATVADGHTVFLVPSGKQILESPIFTADYTTSMDITWDENHFLSIKYDKARIFRFTNFWNTEQLDDWKYIVEIKLDNTSKDGQLTETYRNTTD